MANQKDRRRCRGIPETGPAREPEVTRYIHPVRTMPPCAGDMSWIRGTLACHTQMLEEILERLRNKEEG
mgnify:CR=1 FL=1